MGIGTSSVLFASGSNNVLCPANAALDALCPVSIDAWIYLTAVTGANQIIFRRRAAYGFYLMIDPTGHVMMAAYNSSGASAFSGAITTVLVPLGMWCHVAGTWDGTTVYAYLNSKRGPGVALTGPAGSESVPAYLGNYASLTWPFSGRVGEVRVSDVDRSAGTTTYPVPTRPATIDGSTIGLWHMSEGTGTTCADSGPNSMNGSFDGSPLPVWARGRFFPGTGVPYPNWVTSHFLLGYNYPWYMYNHDLSTTNNIVANATAITAQFVDMAANGCNATRLWLLEDGHNILAFDGNGWVTGFQDQATVFAQMDAIVAIAAANNILLLIDFLSGTFIAKTMAATNTLTFTDSGAQQSFLDNVVKPILQRYGTSSGILAWCLVNEPDYLTTGAYPINTYYEISYANMQSFHAAFTSYVHTYTSQMACIQNGPLPLTYLWTGLGFDFYAPHYYAWMGGTLLIKTGPLTTPAAIWGLDKPIVLSELSCNDATHTVAQLTKMVFENGYAGALFWSVNSGDSYSNYAGTKAQVGAYVASRGGWSTPWLRSRQGQLRRSL